MHRIIRKQELPNPHHKETKIPKYIEFFVLVPREVNIVYVRFSYLHSRSSVNNSFHVNKFIKRNRLV